MLYGRQNACNVHEVPGLHVPLLLDLEGGIGILKSRRKSLNDFARVIFCRVVGRENLCIVYLRFFDARMHTLYNLSPSHGTRVKII